jgi:hypothetical protein
VLATAFRIASCCTARNASPAQIHDRWCHLPQRLHGGGTAFEVAGVARGDVATGLPHARPGTLVVSCAPQDHDRDYPSAPSACSRETFEDGTALSIG